MGLTNVGEVDLGRHPGDDDQGEEEGQAKHQNLHCIFHCVAMGTSLAALAPKPRATDPRAFAFAGAFVDAKLRPKKAACR